MTSSFIGGPEISLLEDKLCDYLSVENAVTCANGTDAIQLALRAVGVTKDDIVLLPDLTFWATFEAVVNVGGTPVTVDISLQDGCLDINSLLSAMDLYNPKAVIIAHLYGWGSMDLLAIRNLCESRNIPLIEDVCESHGAKFQNKKLGTFGLISNFSFYYAHHISTIEGGMVCTNNKKIYHMARSMRAHGMAREIGSQVEEKRIIKKYPKLSPKFIFCYPGFNFRNNEIGAIIGLNQLKRLDANNIKRSKNLEFFLNLLDGKKFYKDFLLAGNSNYAFPLVLKNKSLKNRSSFEKKMKSFNIEFRRGNAGGGNQLRQPYLQKYIKNLNLKKFKNVEHVHFYGYYIGNYPSLTSSKIIKICKILNSTL